MISWSSGAWSGRNPPQETVDPNRGGSRESKEGQLVDQQGAGTDKGRDCQLLRVSLEDSSVPSLHPTLPWGVPMCVSVRRTRKKSKVVRWAGGSQVG